MYKYYGILLFFFSVQSTAQQFNTVLQDTVPSLSEIIIKGYESDRRLLETPVSAGVISSSDMQRYSVASMVPAINAIPGVRMEERSPGSYRLSIRGSLLRSPFGVRNIKVYWNDIPFTDAGGNTYFNLLDQSSIKQIEILKGPAGSIYGANTGGVIILHPDEQPLTVDNNDQKSNRFRVQLSGGSYGLFGENAQWKNQQKNFSSSFTQSHLQSDGYRQNTRLRRDLLQWNGTANFSAKDKIEWIAVYADMFYQTPGGLTLQQIQNDPRQARPATQTLPGAVEQKAAIYNKTIFTGISNDHRFNEHWSNVTSLMFSYTDFKNPFITNFEARSETNAGLRSKMVYQAQAGQHHFRVAGGLEWLFNYSVINNYGNKKGVRDTVQTKDNVWAKQIFPFLQGEWEIGKNLQFQAGASTNFFAYRYRRLTDQDNSIKKKKLDEQLLPRFAALYRITDYLSLHASVSKGFSPPAIAEVRPSEGNFYSNLQPEYGWNYEVGLRGNLLKGRLQFDVTKYIFKLHDAIVRRTTDTGAEYFINAGGTDQKGLEAYVEYGVIQNPTAFIGLVKIWTSGTWNNYSFTDYKMNDNNYSGNALTGVARRIFAGGIDVRAKSGLYMNSSFTYTSKLPLNDANTAFANDYRILLCRLGWKKQFSAVSIEIFSGIDNALNELYSLGNDINAVGSRYYNPAPKRNYYGGIILNL